MWPKCQHANNIGPDSPRHEKNERTGEITLGHTWQNLEKFMTVHLVHLVGHNQLAQRLPKAQCPWGLQQREVHTTGSTSRPAASDDKGWAQNRYEHLNDSGTPSYRAHL